jgi:hypothetical protein
MRRVRLIHPSAETETLTSLLIDAADGNRLLTDSPLPSGSVNQIPAPAGVVIAVIAVGIFSLRWRLTGRRSGHGLS